MSNRARVETARARALAVIDELEQLTPERRPQLDAARRLVIEATDHTLARLERTK